MRLTYVILSLVVDYILFCFFRSWMKKPWRIQTYWMLALRKSSKTMINNFLAVISWPQKTRRKLQSWRLRRMKLMRWNRTLYDLQKWEKPSRGSWEPSRIRKWRLSSRRKLLKDRLLAWKKVWGMVAWWKVILLIETR